MKPEGYVNTERRTYRGCEDGYVVLRDGEERIVDDLYSLAREVGARPGSLNLCLYRKSVHKKTGIQVRYWGDTPYNWK